MKIKRIALCFMALLAAAVLASCSASAATVLEMELTENYDTSEPFIHEKLIYVSEDVESLSLNVAFQMEGESGLLEIADNETGEVFWSEAWQGDVDKTEFTILLDDLDKDREYVVRFTGTKIIYAKITITSDSSLVKERERPLRNS